MLFFSKNTFLGKYFDFVSRNRKRVHDEGSGEIIIRHLVIPGHIECCSKPILDFVAKELSNSVVNIMFLYFSPNYKFWDLKWRDKENSIKAFSDRVQGLDTQPTCQLNKKFSFSQNLLNLE